MPSIHEQLSEQFGALHRRLKGWQVFPEPVTPEPPFQPFTGYTLAPVVDDGRVPTVGSSLLAGLSRWLGGKTTAPAELPVQEEEPEPTPLVRTDLIELQTSLPANLNLPREAFEAFLSQLAACGEPLSFELVGQPEQIHAQFVLSPSDAPLVRRQLNAYFPEAVFSPTQGTLEPFTRDDRHHAIVEFGLARECLFPLASGGKLDPFIGLIGALGELREGERAVYQILFQPCRHRWADSLLRSVTDPEGHSLFVNRPEFAGLIREKVAQPLYAAVVRLAATSDTFEGAWEIVRNLAGALRVFARTDGNELIPLHNEDYPYEVHGEDVVSRQTRRSGMLLSTEELIGFVHLPGASIRAAKFRRQATNTKPAPRTVTGSQGIALGENIHAGETRTVRLTADQRTRHLHVIGASGTGKSTFLESLLSQDLAAGEGFALFDPHGDLVDKVLGRIPEHRIKDVILVDPSDETASIGFNILSAHSDLEKTLLASDLVSVFARLSTSWGDQMEGVLRNAILAFLESSQGGTLADLRRFLLDPKYRERFLATVQDPDIQFYWRKGFAQLTGNKSIGPVLTRLETFLSPKPLRYMVAQPVNRLDFADILDSGKIFLAKLSQGAIGKENAYLLGSLLMAKFQQTAMARQRQAAPLRRDFFIYLDEFQNFITPSLAEILSGARKYRLGLVLAHQELRQLERDREVASAVLSNPYTRVVFRVGDDDARKLESGFSSFTARDLQNLGTGEAVVRIERSDCDFNLSVPLPEEPDPDQAQARRTEVTAASRTRYATPRADIEAALRKQFEVAPAEPEVAAPSAIKKAEASTGSEKKAVPPVESVPLNTDSLVTGPLPTPPSVRTAEVPQVAEPKPPADLGRGGEQHKSIQKRLKEVAEKLGYHVTTEKPVLDRAGSVDLALEHPRRSIAVEITVTTTIDHEVGNVTKCLKAGFPFVAVVSSSEAKLRQMQEAVSGALGPELSVRVSYFLPDAFLAHLEQWAKEDTAADVRQPAERVNRGYKVKRSVTKLTPEELQAKEASALRMVADAMKQKPPG
jgi:hypothetical protein